VRRATRAIFPAIPRAKVWIERAGKLALADAGADLLEQIEAAGSLSEAARRLRYSYRRAWMLLDNMNKQWEMPLVVTSTGGERGGGAKLTELGGRVLRSYRDLQVQIEAAIDRETEGFQRATRVK
jgi:molybdate transport system regulatory protein